MIPIRHFYPNGSRLELDEKSLEAEGKRAIAVVHGEGSGRGCTLSVNASAAGVWIPLREELQFSSGEAVVYPGELRVSESEYGLRATSRGNAIWVALLAGAQTWRELTGMSLGLTLDPPLLPARHAADFSLRRSAVTMRRAARGKDRAAQTLIQRILSLQDKFSKSIAACPGRTFKQRRMVFLRLQRVRNRLAASFQSDFSNEDLARMAGYSSSHFIRAFGAAYGETPHAYLVRQRLKHALRLLHTSPLAIAEVAMASGFDSPSSFSRSFRDNFGTTARLARERMARKPTLVVRELLSEVEKRSL